MDYGPSLKVTEARPCLYYALEGSRAIKLRIAAWRKYMAEEKVELPEHIPMFVVESAQNVLKENERKSACNQLVAADLYCIKNYGQPLGVISLDTLTKAMPSGDQNSVEDTSSLFELVGLLREASVTATIVFVHHKARTGGLRGSTNIEAEPDTLLDISKGKVDKTDIEVRVAKARSIDEGGVYCFSTKTIHLGVTTQDIDLNSFVVIPKDNIAVAGSSIVVFRGKISRTLERPSFSVVSNLLDLRFTLGGRTVLCKPCLLCRVFILFSTAFSHPLTCGTRTILIIAGANKSA